MPYELSMGDDGILRVAFIGDLREEDLEAYVEEIIPLEGAARASGKPLCILVDTRSAGKLNSSARKTLVELGRQPSAQPPKVALLGVTPYVRVLTNFINKAIGREHIHFFSTEEEALVWLKGGA